MKNKIGLLFICLSLIALLGGLFFGSIASLQFVFPGVFDVIPFIKTRPLHVSLVVAWIFLSAVGGIYYYLPNYCGLPLFSGKIAVMQMLVFLITGIIILLCYLAGIFGGREYWEFPAILAIPIILSWILFGINYFKTVFKKIGKWPVYLWMWATGICFFLFTFLESYLWILPYFRDNIVRDLTVQWKAYGALVGSWNMLVYGTAIFLMEQIKKDDKIAHSKLTFLMYFLGLTNLMFGWAHHIYIVPTAPWIRHLSYAISMTELLILAKIIWNWKQSVDDAKKDLHNLSYRFIIASDIWIFLNLTLALLISVPAINIFTHGTHITVAHAMGSTIGINTMILLASVMFVIDNATKQSLSASQLRIINTGYWITNISLVIFWICLILAGAEKGILTIQNQSAFYEIMKEINGYMIAFSFSGLGVFAGLLMTVANPLKAALRHITKKV